MALFRNRGEGEEKAPEGPAAPRPSVPPVASPRAPAAGRQTGGVEMANIGKSIRVKGDVEGDEDTVVEGKVEGRVSLKGHHLTIGPNGDVQGEVTANQVTVVGRVSGNVIATERLEIKDSGRIDGDLYAPRLLVAEGAVINGKIEMKERPGATKPAQNPGSGPNPASTQKAG